MAIGLVVLAGPVSCDQEDATGSLDRDLAYVDDYLAKWDRFARGENDLVPEIGRRTREFESRLARLLEAEDRRAPARMVFYPVVQVGGHISVDTDLGRAALGVLGPDFPIVTFEGEKIIFAGDLYFWWKENGARFESFALFDEWLSRDFARGTAIPMYEGVRRSSR